MPIGVEWKRKFRLLVSSQPLPHGWRSWHSYVPDLQLHQCLHLLSPPSLRHRRSHQCWDLKLDGASSFTTQDRLATSSPSKNQNKEMKTANFFNTFWVPDNPSKLECTAQAGKASSFQNGGCRGCKNKVFSRTSLSFENASETFKPVSCTSASSSFSEK